MLIVNPCPAHLFCWVKIIYEEKYTGFSKQLNPLAAPHSQLVVGSLMVISVRIVLLQNGKCSMTSSKSMFHLYNSWDSAAVEWLRREALGVGKGVEVGGSGQEEAKWRQ